MLTQSVLVLAVDDEPSNNDLMIRAFRGEKEMRVLVAGSGAEALEVIRANAVDVILVDYSMPGMSGIEFLAAAKKTMPEVVAIMVTAFPELKEVYEARDQGVVQHVISKPWQVKTLVDTVKRAISMRKMREIVGRLPDRKGAKDAPAK